MKNKELQAILAKYPDDAEIYMYDDAEIMTLKTVESGYDYRIKNRENWWYQSQSEIQGNNEAKEGWRPAIAFST